MNTATETNAAETNLAALVFDVTGTDLVATVVSHPYAPAGAAPGLWAITVVICTAACENLERQIFIDSNLTEAASALFAHVAATEKSPQWQAVYAAVEALPGVAA